MYTAGGTVPELLAFIHGLECGMFPGPDNASPLEQFNEWLAKGWSVPKEYNWLLTARAQITTRQPMEFLECFQKYFLEIHQIELQIPVLPSCGYGDCEHKPDRQ